MKRGLKVYSILLVVSGILVLSINAYWYFFGIHVSAHPKELIEVEKLVIDPKNNVEKMRFNAGEQIGILSIPKLKQSLPVYEGTSKEILKKGVGHVVSTALPGKNNNSVLSGHRDTVFRKLGELVVGDRLFFTLNEQAFFYKIKNIRIVDKDDHTVIVPRSKSTLTLTTCYPFHIVGPAPKRYIIEAEQIKLR